MKYIDQHEETRAQLLENKKRGALIVLLITLIAVSLSEYFVYNRTPVSVFCDFYGYCWTEVGE